MRATGGLISTNIQQEVVTLARIMKIERRHDGLTTRITDHDQDITIPSEQVRANATFEIAPVNNGAIKAVGVLSLTGVPATGETVTIGGVVYTFTNGALTLTGQVKVGADIAASINNLCQAINAGTGAGVIYASGTTANAFVDAEVTNINLPNLAESTLLATGKITSYFSSFTSNSGVIHDGEQQAATVTQPKTTDQTTSMWFGVALNVPTSITHVLIYPAQMWDTVNSADMPVSWWFGPDGYVPTSLAETMMQSDGFSVVT